MKDKEILNTICDEVYNLPKKVKEDFMSKYDKSDDRIIFESQCTGDGGSSSIAANAPEHTIEVVNGQDSKELKETKHYDIFNREIMFGKKYSDYVKNNIDEKAEDIVNEIWDDPASRIHFIKVFGLVRAKKELTKFVKHKQYMHKLHNADNCDTLNKLFHVKESNGKTYEDVVRLTGNDDEGGNVYDAYRDGLIGWGDAINILVHELGYSDEEADNWLWGASQETADRDDIESEDLTPRPRDYIEEDEDYEGYDSEGWENLARSEAKAEYEAELDENEGDQSWDSDIGPELKSDYEFDPKDFEGEAEAATADWREDLSDRARAVLDDDDLEGYGPDGWENLANAEANAEYEAELSETDTSDIDGMNAFDAGDVIQERIQNRIERNSRLFEAIENGTLKEDIDNGNIPKNLVRYQLQNWTNGGTRKGDGEIDGEVNGPSEYEAWRRGIIDKKRKARVEQENADANSTFRSPRHTKQPKETYDFQEDQFLGDYLKKNKQPVNLNERINAFLKGI